MKFRNFFTVLIFIVLSTLFSFYIFAHIIAVIFLVKIPFINAVSDTKISQVIHAEANDKQFLTDRGKYGFFGKPSTLRIPRLNFSLNLDEATIKNGTFLTTDQIGYFYIFGQSKAGHLGDSLFFTSDNTKTLDIISLLVENDRIVVETNLHWRYHYKVVNQTVVSITQPFLPAHSDTSRIYIGHPSKYDKYLLIEASLQNLEEIIL